MNVDDDGRPLGPTGSGTDDLKSFRHAEEIPDSQPWELVLIAEARRQADGERTLREEIFVQALKVAYIRHPKREQLRHRFYEELPTKPRGLKHISEIP